MGGYEDLDQDDHRLDFYRFLLLNSYQKLLYLPHHQQLQHQLFPTANRHKRSANNIIFSHIPLLDDRPDSLIDDGFDGDLLGGHFRGYVEEGFVY